MTDTVESRELAAALTFSTAANAWAISRGIMTADGQVNAPIPVIIGAQAGSTDLGAFDYGIISPGRTVRQALQDVETALKNRMSGTNNLSELTDVAAARTKLQLGNAAQRTIGTSGSTVPLLDGNNTWDSFNTFYQVVVTQKGVLVDSANPSGYPILAVNKTGFARWNVGTSGTESGSNAGTDLLIRRYSDTGTFIDTPFSIARSSGVVTLSKPLPVTSGGTGVTSLVSLRQSLGLDQVTNSADADKPVSTAQQTALDTKYSKSGGVVSGNVIVQSAASPTLRVLNSSNGKFVDFAMQDDSNCVFYYNDGTTTVPVWSINGTAESFRVNPVALFNSVVVGRSTLTSNASGSTSYAQLTTDGSVELTNAAGAYIDFKTDYAEDYDVRIWHNVAANCIQVGGSGGLIVDGAGALLAVNQSANWWTNFFIKNSYMNATRSGGGSIGYKNENGIIYTSINSICYTDGHSSWDISPTSPGSRTQDRRAVTMWGDHAGITMNVGLNCPSVNGLRVSNAGDFIRRSTDIAANGYWSRQLVLGGNAPQDDVWAAPPEIRGVNGVGNTQSSSPYAPSILFHWSNTAAATLKMFSDGSLRYITNGGPWPNYGYLYGSDFCATNWFRTIGTGGMYWNTYSRGLSVADSGGSYGTVNVYGAGMNGFQGYTINNHIAFMSDGTTSGFYSQSRNTWMLRFDGTDATFPGNVTAYSDERLKKNKRPIDNVRQRREALARGAILYERKGITRIGYGAQTIRDKNPEVVFEDTNSLINVLSVNYGDTTAILAADNQELSDKIDVLEQQVAALIEQIKILTSSQP